MMSRMKVVVVLIAMMALVPCTALSAERPGEEFRRAEMGVSNRILLAEREYALGKYEPREGVYLGAYVLQDAVVGGDMDRFNHAPGKKHASFFRYVGYGQPLPREWVEEVKAAGAVPHIALEPNDGLDEVKDDEYLLRP